MAAMLNKVELVEIIMRQQTKKFSHDTYKHWASTLSNNQVLRMARELGLNVFLRNGVFYINQKLS